MAAWRDEINYGTKKIEYWSQKLTVYISLRNAYQATMYTLEREAQLYRQTATHYGMIAKHGDRLFFRPEDLAQLAEHERWKLEQNSADQRYIRERIEIHEENVIFAWSMNVVYMFAQGWASVLFKRTEQSLRSFPFFIKERSDLCILLRSL